ncbi:MAG: efflux RND transporter periplasmic adaptor subunit [Gammaproteobacteria bacterium]|nr:MAG: efflux RND transporter periplasmic adaptor subunit [Gammaproteobacteria bacterium]
MEALFEWLNPARWLVWAQDNPWLALAIGVPLAAVVVWRLIKGGLGIRRTVINVVGIGLVIWGTLWFADWVQPSLTARDLFPPPVMGPQAVKAILAEQKTLERTATYTGAVYPYERVVLRARTSGFVNEIAAYPGDKVEAGQVIVELETSELEPQLEKARAELRFLRAELARDEKLFRDGVISSSTTELSRSKERVAAATVNLLETEIGYATVRALSDGWVSKRAVDPGQYVRKGDHLIAYDRLAQVRVRFDVAIQDLVQIAPGTEVTLEFPDIPARRLVGTVWEDRQISAFSTAAVRAKVASVFPAADEKSRLGVVEVIIPNPDLLLKSNTYAVGHLVTARVEDAWAVPERALTPMPDGKTVIFLAPPFSDQGEAEMREVKVGLRNGKEAQILEGLEEPAYVVVAGNRSLTNGETVIVIAREGGF